MTIYDEIKEKIKKNINYKNITLIDNSYFHKSHKSYDSKKLHLKIIIESEELTKMNKISAHKEIFSILKDLMKNRIHALEIEIK